MLPNISLVLLYHSSYSQYRTTPRTYHNILITTFLPPPARHLHVTYTIFHRSKRAQLVTIVKARRAAARVECVYRVLRVHALANRGHITKEVRQRHSRYIPLLSIIMALSILGLSVLCDGAAMIITVFYTSYQALWAL